MLKHSIGPRTIAASNPHHLLTLKGMHKTTNRMLLLGAPNIYPYFRILHFVTLLIIYAVHQVSAQPNFRWSRRQLL